MFRKNISFIYIVGNGGYYTEVPCETRLVTISEIGIWIIHIVGDLKEF